MYKTIEKIYMEKSPYNILKREMGKVYFPGIMLVLIFSAVKCHILIIISILVASILLIRTIRKHLKVNVINLILKDSKTISAARIEIGKTETDIFKNILIKNGMYEEKKLKCIINHYQSLQARPKKIFDLISIISLIITIASPVLSFINFGEESVTNMIAFYIVYIVLISIICIMIKDTIELKSFLKGRDGIYENLELIFTKIYFEKIDFSNPKDVKKVNSKKSKYKKTQNKKTKKD